LVYCTCVTAQRLARDECCLSEVTSVSAQADLALLLADWSSHMGIKTRKRMNDDSLMEV